MPASSRALLPLLLLALLALAAPARTAAQPVAFAFDAPPDPAVTNPFARELWADVTTPSGRTLHLPAYYAGGSTFAVHVRRDETGDYRVGDVTDTSGGKPAVTLAVQLRSDRSIAVPSPAGRPAIERDPQNPGAFRRSDGRAFVPVGANLAWSPTGQIEYFRQALPAFARGDLNWKRVWMCHWGGLDLDWVVGAPSPVPGRLDARVAAKWDELLAIAEREGVYLQVVFQHHGQFSTGTNPNWSRNPWNAANRGGFLGKPADFFTSPVALALTKSKYRYVVARWGWSPAVFAWELFNEVHWVDAWAKQKDLAAVARWHSTLAAYVRSIDAYHHLVTTSTEDLQSPVYEGMDFYQPHLYPADPVAAVRSHAAPADPTRPVFYGEEGEDNLAASDEVKKSGVAIIPAVWASVMGHGTLPAQPWDGWKLVEQNRLAELGAVNRFITASQFPLQHGLQPFSAVVETVGRVPLRLVAAQVWQRRPAAEIAYPLDGRVPVGAADVPLIYVGNERGLADGFPGRVTYHLDFPRVATVRARVTETGRKGGALRLRVDGQAGVMARSMGPALPAELVLDVSAGPHTLVVENPADGWVALPELDLGLDTSELAAIGQRNDTFVALWLWRRAQLYALAPPPPVAGTLVLDAVPAGTWHVTWWDTTTGQPAAPVTLDHPGGALRLPVPPISRHAAVVLTR